MHLLDFSKNISWWQAELLAVNKCVVAGTSISPMALSLGFEAVGFRCRMFLPEVVPAFPYISYKYCVGPLLKKNCVDKIWIEISVMEHPSEMVGPKSPELVSTQRIATLRSTVSLVSGSCKTICRKGPFPWWLPRECVHGNNEFHAML